MTTQIDTIAAGFSAIFATAFGSRALPVLADTAELPMPDWLRMLLGPLGALVGLIIALWWMAQRLNRAEGRFEERDKERDADRRSLILVVEQNSQALRQVTSVIAKCKGHTAHPNPETE
jgi:hypothetical protein